MKLSTLNTDDATNNGNNNGSGNVNGVIAIGDHESIAAAKNAAAARARKERHKILSTSGGLEGIRRDDIGLYRGSNCSR